MHLWALLLAAGSGSRMQSATDGLAKQFICWKGLPLYWHSAMTLSRCARLRGLIFVFPPGLCAVEALRVHDLDLAHPLGIPWQCVAGGATRQNSVRNALLPLPLSCDSVLIHDAARPFVSPTLINRVIDALDGHPMSQSPCGVVPGVPLSDTVKILRQPLCPTDESGLGETANGIRGVNPAWVESTPDRQRLVTVQTPQGFILSSLKEAHVRAAEQGWSVTDDASLLELCAMTVQVVTGETDNRKITTPEDLAMLVTPPPAPRPCVGYGYDVHRYAAPTSNAVGQQAKALLSDVPLRELAPIRTDERPMILGGVPIPGAPEVLAHSDGDVLLHALMDALLGCIGGGDIGLHFPDTDPTLDGVSSAILLDTVLGMSLQAGLCIAHVDITLVAQKPKISPHRESIRKNLARLLGLAPEAVNVKATTEEGLGFTGEGKGIKAIALVTGSLAMPS